MKKKCNKSVFLPFENTLLLKILFRPTTMKPFTWDKHFEYLNHLLCDRYLFRPTTTRWKLIGCILHYNMCSLNRIKQSHINFKIHLCSLQSNIRDIPVKCNDVLELNELDNFFVFITVLTRMILKQ